MKTDRSRLIGSKEPSGNFCEAFSRVRFLFFREELLLDKNKPRRSLRAGCDAVAFNWCHRTNGITSLLVTRSFQKTLTRCLLWFPAFLHRAQARLRTAILHNRFPRPSAPTVATARQTINFPTLRTMRWKCQKIPPNGSLRRYERDISTAGGDKCETYYPFSSYSIRLTHVIYAQRRQWTNASSRETGSLVWDIFMFWVTVEESRIWRYKRIGEEDFGQKWEIRVWPNVVASCCWFRFWMGESWSIVNCAVACLSQTRSRIPLITQDCAKAWRTAFNALHNFCCLTLHMRELSKLISNSFAREAETGSHSGYSRSRENYCPGLITVGTLRSTRKLIKTFEARINAGCHAKVWRVNTLQFSAFRIQFIYYWPVPVLMSTLCLFISKLSGERPIYFSCDAPPSAMHPYLIRARIGRAYLHGGKKKKEKKK